jgi:hypothetical protein
MVQPRLIHPCSITIKRVDHGTTLYDEDAREPLQQATRLTSVTIQGQVSWADTSQKDTGRSGVLLNAQGYVLFRKLDLDAAGFAIQINDRISKMGHVETDVYVERLEWIGHYTELEGPTMIRAYFSDRLPSKQVGQ